VLCHRPVVSACQQFIFWEYQHKLVCACGAFCGTGVQGKDIDSKSRQLKYDALSNNSFCAIPQDRSQIPSPYNRFKHPREPWL